MHSTSNQWARIEEIFTGAVQLADRAQQKSYVALACQGDPQLELEVLELLDSHASPNAYLQQPPVIDNTDDLNRFDHRNESQIGRYKILQEIGEGGFGVVYMAEQVEPVRRKVALKVIKPGMDSRTVIARFEAERQALAMMNHLNIARVLDGGSTSSGYPYFVMDLVRGIPITEYCDQANLPTKQRLELFISVCHAIQHAHQKGIIHRDIKPSNIMVTLHDSLPVVKVIDFGVAKALNQQLTEKTLFTSYGAMVGTPQYMSPEQAAMSGLDVDTRSDIYSLGVLLYELLTGRTPFSKEQLNKAGFEDLKRLICETEPTKPSMALSTFDEPTVTKIAHHRQLEPQALSRILRGELDWIVMKALDKERTRRYSTAFELAEDLQRYLANEPVTACPPSIAYRTQKYVRRHRALMATAATILLAISASAVIAGRGWVNERRIHSQLQFKQDELLQQITHSVVSAEANQLEQAIQNLLPLNQMGEAKIREVVSKEKLTFAQQVNTKIALGELKPSEKVGDFLLENIGAMDRGLCQSLVSVLRKTDYDPQLLTNFARHAEQARDLPTKSRIAIVGLYLRNPAIAKDMLQFGVDPIQRSHFLQTFSRWHGSLSELAQYTKSLSDSAFRSGLIQAVGLVEAYEISQADRDAWIPLLRQWNESASDLVTRNSAQWLMRRWSIELPPPTATKPRATHDWFVNEAGITMRRIQPGRFTMGDWEGIVHVDFVTQYEESPRQVEITRPFYLADREATAAQFRQWAATKAILGSESTTDDFPTADWSRGLAMQFCNWLSENEKLQPCYRLETTAESKKHMDGWRLNPDANGYRFPTEAEWEYACRAGTITQFSWGQDQKFRSLFVTEDPHPVGITLPNPWGLFDMHGSLLEACEDTYGLYSQVLGLKSLHKDPLNLATGENFVIRGRTFKTLEQRSSVREQMEFLEYVWFTAGLRIARDAESLPEVVVQPQSDESRAAEITRCLALNVGRSQATHFAERGICQLRLGRKEQAAQDFKELLSVMQPYEDWGALRTQFLVHVAQDEELVGYLSKLLPNDLHLQICRARNAGFRGDWIAAANIVKPLLKIRDQRQSRWRVMADDQEWHEMALYLLMAGLEKEYREYRSWMIEEVKRNPEDIRFHWTVLKAATLRPIESLDEQQTVHNIPLKEEADWGGAIRFAPYGYALYRAGNPQDMIDAWIGKDFVERPGQPRSRIFLAMAKWDLGEKDEARKQLTIAQESVRKLDASIRNGWKNNFWWMDNNLSARVLLKEAEQKTTP